MSAPSEQSQRPAQMLSRRGGRFGVRRPAQRGRRGGRASHRVRAQLSSSSSSSSSDSEASAADSDERVVPLRGRPYPMAAPHPSFLHTYLEESRRGYIAESPPPQQQQAQADDDATTVCADAVSSPPVKGEAVDAVGKCSSSTMDASRNNGVLVSGGIGAVEVRILAAHEAALLVVCMQESGRQFVPCVSHDLLNSSFSDWAALAADLLPVVEQRVVERAHALGSVRRHEQDVFDGL